MICEKDLEKRKNLLLLLLPERMAVQRILKWHPRRSCCQVPPPPNCKYNVFKYLVLFLPPLFPRTEFSELIVYYGMHNPEDVEPDKELKRHHRLLSTRMSNYHM
mmetsp:Transcript_15544/g.25448  ORF Transcript_15544/g.25448 Transcript_15544/m.25448 type:complete len:104 (-) Transcript_15544:1339-1650(-)